MPLSPIQAQWAVVGQAVHRASDSRVELCPDVVNADVRVLYNIVRLSNCANDVKTIKLADCIANMRDIIREDPKFAPTYLAEKRVALDRALVGGDSKLWGIADKLITDYFAQHPPKVVDTTYVAMR